MVDKITYNGAHGVSGAADQYADGKAAKIWKIVVGDENSRTENYKNFFIDILKQNNCHRVLDSACGTGVDSTMLLEAGFEVASTDASDKMLKHTYKTRWDNRKDPRYDKWIIDEANWITLYEDVKHFLNDGFDAVFCLGNSFAHLLDNYGDQREQRQALANFEKCIKPGGIFIIDHRNFESITESGSTPHKSIYYTNNLDIKTSVLIVSGVKRMVTLDYSIFAPENANGKEKSIVGDFVMSYYPHQSDDFRGLLREAFGPKAHIETYGDFKELKENDNPTFYIHVVKKPL